MSSNKAQELADNPAYKTLVNLLRQQVSPQSQPQ